MPFDQQSKAQNQGEILGEKIEDGMQQVQCQAVNAAVSSDPAHPVNHSCRQSLKRTDEHNHVQQSAAACTSRAGQARHGGQCRWSTATCWLVCQMSQILLESIFMQAQFHCVRAFKRSSCQHAIVGSNGSLHNAGLPSSRDAQRAVTSATKTAEAAAMRAARLAASVGQTFETQGISLDLTDMPTVRQQCALF